jgi:hypothetical protein
MASVSNQERERALKAVAFWCISQVKGVEPEENVLKELGFGSVEAMHKQLANWGLPDWLAGGAPNSSEQDEQERRARTASEEPTELPAAYSALPLFYGALQKLNRAIGDLENRKEYLQNGRFVVQEDVSQRSGPVMDVQETLKIPLGGQQTPLEPLPALIAAYFLADEPLKPLLEKLNKRPETVDKEQIRKLIEGEKTPNGHIRGLKSVADLIARGVRGGKIRASRTTGEFSTKIQNGVWYSQQLAQSGFPAEVISKRLREANFSPSEISQVRELNKLPGPE